MSRLLTLGLAAVLALQASPALAKPKRFAPTEAVPTTRLEGHRAHVVRERTLRERDQAQGKARQDAFKAVERDLQGLEAGTFSFNSAERKEALGRLRSQRSLDPDAKRAILKFYMDQARQGQNAPALGPQERKARAQALRQRMKEDLGLAGPPASTSVPAPAGKAKPRGKR